MIPYWVYNFLVICAVWNLAALYISFRILFQVETDMPPSHQTRSGLPYKDHPLYKLRIASIVTAILGFLFNFIAIVALIDYNSYQIPPFMFSLIFLFISFVFVIHDLITYAAAKVIALVSKSDLPIVNIPTSANAASPANENGEPLSVRNVDNKLAWPSRRLVIFDIVLAIIFQFMFWVEFGVIVSSYHRFYGGGTETFEAYANLTNVAASLLHAVAFWKELMARKKQSWERELEATLCHNCGHINDFATVPQAAAGSATAPPSSSILEDLVQAKASLSTWTKRPTAKQYTGSEDRDVEDGAADVEAPLLVTPDESTTEVAGHSGYGTLEKSTGSIPETIVKKKGKGKKRLVEVDSE